MKTIIACLKECEKHSHISDHHFFNSNSIKENDTFKVGIRQFFAIKELSSLYTHVDECGTLVNFETNKKIKTLCFSQEEEIKSQK